MLELQYTFNENMEFQQIDVVGMTGYEQVSTLKEALALLQLSNPCTSFAKKYKALVIYDKTSEEQMVEEARIADILSTLWCYHDNAEELLPSMNVLTILSNLLTEYIRIINFDESHKHQNSQPEN